MTTITHEQGVTLLRVSPDSGALDAARIEQFQAASFQAVDQAEPPLILLDLSDQYFIGSSFIGVILRVWKRIRARGGRMALGGVNGACKQSLEVSKLASIWEIYPTREEALQSLLTPPAT